MSALVEAVPILRSLLIDAEETWHHEREEDAEAMGIRARNALSDIEQLIEASQRTVDAFIAAYRSSGMDAARAHLVCEAAMLEQAAALRRVQGTA